MSGKRRGVGNYAQKEINELDSYYFNICRKEAIRKT
jgi:hypothetical protein